MFDLNKEEKWLLAEKYQGVESDEFRADLERLAEGEPLAYLIGNVPFLDCQIYLDSRPLIPRSETEFWVERAIEKIKVSNIKAPRILDLCAGSGCIGVTVAKSVPEAQVTLAELEPAHLPTISKNIQFNLSNRLDRCEILQSDLFKQVSGKFDFILTNPPYIDPVLDRTTKSVKKFEPALALYGGLGGMEIISKIVQEAPAYLNEKGQLWIEHEPEQSLPPGNFSKVETFNDQFEVRRYSVFHL